MLKNTLFFLEHLIDFLSKYVRFQDFVFALFFSRDQEKSFILFVFALMEMDNC